ncbi:hypothetical protein DY000_02007711 [Brassica cretica]|uniref:Uncharacterized protein n=1 Tax=Brassica cretica TaxID=69181 RepID=A0ABQ7BYI0_BRACR|nr:hypothetical protein DY000_02007711 [Brassica cretica]
MMSCLAVSEEQNQQDVVVWWFGVAFERPAWPCLVRPRFGGREGYLNRGLAMAASGDVLRTGSALSFQRPPRCFFRCIPPRNDSPVVFFSFFRCRCHLSKF